MAFFGCFLRGQKDVKMRSFFRSEFYRKSSGILDPYKWKKAPKRGDFFLDYVGTFLIKYGTPLARGLIGTGFEKGSASEPHIWDKTDLHFTRF